VRGYYKVLGEEGMLSFEEAESIMRNLVGDKGFINKQDFMIGTMNYKNKNAFMGYMHSAYNQFFKNEFESVDT
jgi:hypothetical protein